MTTSGPKVYNAIAGITAALARVGIGKDRKADAPGANYKFRGIDDIYNALAPLLAEHKLCILPTVLDRTCSERQSARGNALFCVNLTVRFDFVSTQDGSKHEIVTLGEAMDSGDKATNKAMSAAYKYAAMMAFCIPTVGEDGENDTHEVTPAAPRPSAPARSAAVSMPPGRFRALDAMKDHGHAPKPPEAPHDPDTGELLGPHLLKQHDGEGAQAWGSRYIAAIKTATTLADLESWQTWNDEILRRLSAKAATTYNIINGETAKQAARIGPEMADAANAGIGRFLGA
jgi:hypothetical protein